MSGLGIMHSERVECIGDCCSVFAGLCVHRKDQKELIQLCVEIIQTPFNVVIMSWMVLEGL